MEGTSSHYKLCQHERTNVFSGDVARKYIPLSLASSVQCPRGCFELSKLFPFVRCFSGIYFEFLGLILLWFPNEFSSFFIYTVDKECDQSLKGKLKYYSTDYNRQIISYLHQTADKL